MWGEGFYQMDVGKRLRAKLKEARLILGDVEETIPSFLPAIKHPIGFVAFDLDYYSSTKKRISSLGGPARYTIAACVLLLRRSGLARACLP